MYRIMLVDDEVNILNALERTLARERDFEIETFDNPELALERAREAEFELVLSDYRMPALDGVSLLSAVKLLQPEAMRLILSGYADLEALVAAINRAEIFRFISKPWDSVDLVLAIRQALAHRAVVVENRRLADQVRSQEKELERRKIALNELRAKHPALVDINWGPDGSIVLDDNVLDTGEFKSLVNQGNLS